MTDTAGNVSQFVWYASYGESLVDEHTTTYENPFKFSGKELDDITGLYDYGARNRNPITAVWYGIDELFEKYPENGPYGYCGGNPVKYFDPDGRVKCDDDGRVSISFDSKKVHEEINKRLNAKTNISDDDIDTYYRTGIVDVGDMVTFDEKYRIGVGLTDNDKTFLVLDPLNSTGPDDNSNCSGLAMLGGQYLFYTPYEADIVLKNEYELYHPEDFSQMGLLENQNIVVVYQNIETKIDDHFSRISLFYPNRENSTIMVGMTTKDKQGPASLSVSIGNNLSFVMGTVLKAAGLRYYKGHNIQFYRPTRPSKVKQRSDLPIEMY